MREQIKIVENPTEKMQKLQQQVRDKLASIEKIKAVREELSMCYKREGVNHLVNCKSIREEYGRLVVDTNPLLIPPPKK